MSIYRLRREKIETTQGPVTVKEFTVYEADVFYSFPPEIRLSVLFPDKIFTSQDKEKLLEAMTRVNAPLPTPPERPGKKPALLTVDEAITYICETSPGENRKNIIEKWSRRQVFYWMKTSGDLKVKLSGKETDNTSAGEFDGHMGEVEAKLKAVPNVSLDDKIKFFAQRWGKSEEEIRAEWKPEKIENAWRNLHMGRR